MQLSEFHASLRASPDLVDLTKSIANRFASRNLAPLDGVEEQVRNNALPDELAQQYARLVDTVTELVRCTDLADDSSIKGQRKYDGLRRALDLASARSDRTVDLKYFVHLTIADFLREHTPGIDEYVERMEDVTILDDLGLRYDSYKLVDVSAKGFDLRNHALVVSNSQLVYPHQFMRRFYSANFVNLLGMLRDCIGDSLSVKLRIDPLRSPTDPMHYREIIEEDWWSGKPFSDSLLRSADKQELVTRHWSPDDKLHSNHPVKFTLFRTSMVSAHQRQFTIEEYTPPRNERFPSADLPGFGKRHCIQKFGHLVYDQQDGTFNHLDGAVRVFTIDDYVSIFQHLTAGRVPDSKIGDRHKLFLVEGQISLERAQRLLYEFFMYNPHPMEYFSPS